MHYSDENKSLLLPSLYIIIYVTTANLYEVHAKSIVVISGTTVERQFSS